MRLRALFHRHEWVSDWQLDDFVKEGLALGLPVGSVSTCRTCGACSCGGRHEGSPAAVSTAATGLADPRRGQP